jgi:protein O-mannosyl-transferase
MKEKVQQWLSNRPEFIWGGVLFVLAFLLYANTIGHKYVWDDDIVIVYNTRVQKGFSSIPSHFQFRTRENFEDFTGYRPITMTSFSIDIGLFGMNPKAGHFMNVLFFALCVVVLFRTLRRLFSRYHAAFSFFVALLFAVHPIHVEAVANIKSRDEILALLFALLALNHFIQHYETGKWLSLGRSALYLAMGALSKEGALTYLAVLPIAVVFLMEGDWRRKAIAIAKFPVIILVLVGIFLLLTGHLPGTSSTVATKGFLESQTLGNCMASPDFVQGDWQRIGNSTFLFWKNLEKFFYPVDLVYFSGYNMYPLLDWTRDALHLGILFTIMTIMILGSLIFWRRLRILTFAFWYYFFTIIIFLQLPRFLLADTIADRFLFLPSVGLCIAVIYVLYRLLGIDLAQDPWAVLRGKLPKPRFKALVFGGLIGVLAILLGGMTIARNRVWKDNLTLFSHDLPLLENCARAHYYYASEIEKGLPTSRNATQDQAMVELHYKRAIEITQQSYYAYVRLAEHYMRLKNYAAASKLMEEAVRVYPGQPDVWNLKGMSLYYQAKYTDAARALEQARLLRPDLQDNWEFLARAYELNEQFEEALQTLSIALERDANYPFYYDALSDTYFDMGDTTASFQPIVKLLEMEPTNPVWWRKIIGRYQIIGDADHAAYYYQQALAKGVAL